MRLYRPSNGSEGMSFIETYCATCIHEEWMQTQSDSAKKCGILSRTYLYGIEDSEYPNEWRYVDGQPKCIKYEWRDDRPDGAKHHKMDPNHMRLF